MGWTKAGVKQEDHRREAERSVGQTMMGLRQTWAGIAKSDSRTTYDVDQAGHCSQQYQKGVSGGQQYHSLG